MRISVLFIYTTWNRSVWHCLQIILSLSLACSLVGLPACLLLLLLDSSNNVIRRFATRRHIHTSGQIECLPINIKYLVLMMSWNRRLLLVDWQIRWRKKTIHWDWMNPRWRDFALMYWISAIDNEVDVKLRMNVNLPLLSPRPWSMSNRLKWIYTRPVVWKTAEQI